MDNRRIIYMLMAGCLSAIPDNTMAFEVGNIAVKNPPAQNFQAEIRLRMSGDEELKSVAMGSSADYGIMQLTRSKSLDSIKVSSSVQDGEALIVLSSSKPLPQKTFDLVLQITSNKQVHFPVFRIKSSRFLASAKTAEMLSSAEQKVSDPQPVAQKSRQSEPDDSQVFRINPTVTQSAPKADAEELQSTRASQTVTSAKPPVTVPARKYGPVQNGDILSSIANGLYREGGSSIYQIMAALFERNPDHFIAGNMNNLTSGGILSVPSEQEIATINDHDSRVLYMNHTKVWRQVLAGRKVALPPHVPLMPASVAVEVPVEEPPPEVIAAPPSESQSVEIPVQPPVTAMVPAGLEKVLLQLETQLGKLTTVLQSSQEQQARLESRVSSLETKQVNTDALANRVTALEKEVLAFPRSSVTDSSPLLNQTALSFQWMTLGLVAIGLFFMGGLVWLGRRWNRQAQRENLEKFLVETAQEHPFMVQDALKQTEPQLDDNFVPAIHKGKTDGVPLATDKKVISGDLRQKVNRFNAMSQRRGEAE